MPPKNIVSPSSNDLTNNHKETINAFSIKIWLLNSTKFVPTKLMREESTRKELPIYSYISAQPQNKNRILASKIYEKLQGLTL
jgi:hypothetical protein